MTPEQIENAVQSGVERGIADALHRTSEGHPPCTACLIHTTDPVAVAKHTGHHDRLDGLFSGVEWVKTEMFSSLKQLAVTLFKLVIIAVLLALVIGFTRLSMSDILSAFNSTKKG